MKNSFFFFFLLLLIHIILINGFQKKKIVSFGLNKVHVPHENIPRYYQSYLKSKASGPINFPSGGNILPLGIYWTEVSLGTPPQTFQLAIDTGSTDLILPEKNCQGCHPDFTGEFDPSKSSTYETLPCSTRKVFCRHCSDSQCAFSNTYETCNLTAPSQPCTVTGVLNTDTFAMGSLSAADMVFGLIQYQTKNFQQFFYIDGVMGISYPGSSSFGYHSAFQALVNEGEVEDVFSLCFNENDGGVLTLGGYDSSFYSGEIQWSPQTSESAYKQHLEGVYVNGKNLNVGSSQIIIDSGTNTLLQPHSNFVAIQNAITEPCSTSNNAPEGVCDQSLFNGTCFKYTQNDRDWFPTITLQLEGAKLSMNGTQYLIQVNGTNSFCFGVKNTGFFGLNIIGDVLMQNYYSIFDNKNKRIGWADVDRANCMKK